LRSKGLTPVLLGTTEKLDVGIPNDGIEAKISSEIDKSLFVDLTNKTTLVEALGVIQRAKAVVGVDNGLLHLAHCTDVPIVYGLSSLLPEHRIPYRAPAPPRTAMEAFHGGVREHGATEIIVADVPCSGCQSRGFAINNDWRTCLFDDYACTLTLTSAKYLAKLKVLGVLT
jgi:hypothetical protein